MPEMANVGRFAGPNGVEFDTRMEPATLQYLADTYGHVVLPDRIHTRWKRGLYFYLYFMWMNLGLNPEIRSQWSGVQNAGDNWDGISKATFYNDIVPIGDALAFVIAEVVYEDRCALS